MERCAWCLDGGLMQSYHDTEWGVPLHDDGKLFEYLSLEALQCGLSWALMLKKRAVFRKCFMDFDPAAVASLTEEDIDRILTEEGMLRSRRKIEAIRSNAKRFLAIQEEFGSFDRYLWAYTENKVLIYESHLSGGMVTDNELSARIAADLKKRGFKYLGAVTICSFLQSCGVINDHAQSCYRYPQLLPLQEYAILRD